MGDHTGKIWAAVAAFFAAPFALLAANFDMETAWRAVFLQALIIVSPIIAIGLTEVIDAAYDGTLSKGRKIVIAAGFGGLPTLILAYPLSAWFPGGLYGITVLWLFMCSIPPPLWAFVPVIRQGALAELSRKFGEGMRSKVVKAEGHPARIIQEGDTKLPGEETVVMDDSARAQLGMPPKTPKP